MGQQEVYDLLKKNRSEWFTSKEIANLLMASLGSVTSCLKKLRESYVINFKYGSKSGSGKNAYIYKFRK